ncbi:MAG: hypothetical protein OEX02_21310, partial [Cyclobacteriaceae bacterium]|nr:hypothetical protein [Cyclobacteriaceae bacterium]
SPFEWTAPENGMREYDQLPPLKQFNDLAAFRKGTGLEQHGVLVDTDIFMLMTLPDPTKPHAVYLPEQVDFRLRAKSGAIDKGVRLPNINDRFTGKAPDLGALEYGGEGQIYGPRE